MTTDPGLECPLMTMEDSAETWMIPVDCTSLYVFKSTNVLNTQVAMSVALSTGVLEGSTTLRLSDEQRSSASKLRPSWTSSFANPSHEMQRRLPMFQVYPRRDTLQNSRGSGSWGMFLFMMIC